MNCENQSHISCRRPVSPLTESHWTHDDHQCSGSKGVPSVSQSVLRWPLPMAGEELRICTGFDRCKLSEGSSIKFHLQKPNLKNVNWDFFIKHVLWNSPLKWSDHNFSFHRAFLFILKHFKSTSSIISLNLAALSTLRCKPCGICSGNGHLVGRRVGPAILHSLNGTV